MLKGLHKNRMVSVPVGFMLGALATSGLLAAIQLNIEQISTTIVALYGVWLVWSHSRDTDDLRKYFDDLAGLAAVAWIIECHTRGWAAWSELAQHFIIGSALLTGLWIANQRTRTQVKLERKILNWPNIAKNARKLQTTWVTDLEANGFIESFILNWKPGEYEPDEVIGMVRKIEGMWGAKRNTMFIEYNGDDNDSVRAKVVKKDLHAENVRWRGATARSICDEIDLGPYRDGERATFKWWERGIGGFHVLIAGLTRSGKSGLINMLIASYARADDVCFWLADFKGGDTMLKWAPLADWLVITTPDGIEMITALENLLRDRAKLKAERGWEVWIPSREDPVIIFMCDEIAELLGLRVNVKTLAKIESLGRMGAGLGVLMLLATQYPTVGGALGSSQLKTQLGWRASFRLQANDQMQYILPNAPKGLDPSKISDTRKGTCYVDANGKFRNTTLRVPFISRDKMEAVVRDNYLYSGSLGGKYDHIMPAKYLKRMHFTPDILEKLKRGSTIEELEVIPDLEPPEEMPPNLTKARGDRDMPWIEEDAPGARAPISEVLASKQLTDEEKREVEARLARARGAPPVDLDAEILRLLEAADTGLTPAKLLESLQGVTERRLHRRLQALRETGKIDHVSRGRYVRSGSGRLQDTHN